MACPGGPTASAAGARAAEEEIQAVRPAATSWAEAAAARRGIRTHAEAMLSMKLTWPRAVSRTTLVRAFNVDSARRRQKSQDRLACQNELPQPSVSPSAAGPGSTYQLVRARRCKISVDYPAFFRRGTTARLTAGQEEGLSGSAWSQRHGKTDIHAVVEFNRWHSRATLISMRKAAASILVVGCFPAIKAAN